jgi:XRE family transcriptional regulator, regulator of sulfur utilization
MKYFLLSLFLAPILVATAQPPVVNTYAPPKDLTVLGTTFVDWDSLTSRTTPVGESRAVFDNPTATLEKLEVHVSTLLPGISSHPVHRHPWEEILLIKEGNIEVSINGHKQHAGPGYMIFFASNDPHNATNTGSTPATYYVINFVTDRVHSVPDKAAVEQAVPGKLPSSVIDCNSLPSTPTKVGSHVSVVSSPTLTFAALESHISTLNVGQSTAKDILDPGDEFVVIKSGSVEVTVNGVASRMKEGSMLYWAPNDKRTLRNLGATPASYQVIRVISDKSPKPIVN